VSCRQEFSFQETRKTFSHPCQPCTSIRRVAFFHWLRCVLVSGQNQMQCCQMQCCQMQCSKMMQSFYCKCGQTTASTLNMISTTKIIQRIASGGETKVVVPTSVLMSQFAVSRRMFIFPIAGALQAVLTTTNEDSG